MTPPFRMVESLTSLPVVTHGFFGRQGGVSQSSFASLNVSETCGDDADNVRTNRRRIALALGAMPGKLTTARQVHSRQVSVITSQTDFSARPQADGLVSRTPGIALGILTADCVPVLFADPGAGVIGAAHAGWKGAAGGIVDATIAAMVSLGARRDAIRAAIGPAISQANYEVSEDFRTDLVTLYPQAEKRFQAKFGQKPHFDLPGFVEDRLREAGLAAISNLALCTYAESEVYFSHRFATHANAETGRQLSVIALS